RAVRGAAGCGDVRRLRADVLSRRRLPGEQVQQHGLRALGGVAEVDRAEPGCGVERDRRVADGDAEADRADAGVLRAGGDRAEQAAADAAPAVGGHDSHAQLRDVVGDVAQAGVLPAEPTQPRGTDRDLQPAGAAHVDGDDAEVALALPAGDVVRQRAVAQQLL